jgi:hypothetical protein
VNQPRLERLDIEGNSMAMRRAGDREKTRAAVAGEARHIFALEELVSWMKALPRMEAHVLDGPHRPIRPSAPR